MILFQRLFKSKMIFPFAKTLVIFLFILLIFYAVLYHLMYFSFSFITMPDPDDFLNCNPFIQRPSTLTLRNPSLSSMVKEIQTTCMKEEYIKSVRHASSEEIITEKTMAEQITAEERKNKQLIDEDKTDEEIRDAEIWDQHIRDEQMKIIHEETTGEEIKRLCRRYQKEGLLDRPVFVSPWMKYSSISVEGVTMVTHMSVDRLNVFEYLLSLWSGPISVAVEVECGTSLQILVTYMEKWIQRDNLNVHIVLKMGVCILCICTVF